MFDMSATPTGALFIRLLMNFLMRNQHTFMFLPVVEFACFFLVCPINMLSDLLLASFSVLLLLLSYPRVGK